jgi:pimeloyl-ACP methyl ester carboxylesterase
VQRTRDIVLVDQRGTGKSNPLNCRSDANSLREMTESTDAGLDRLKRCLSGYDADVRLYTTNIAMDDLDEVRAYLGYDRVNLYGGSYGTRAALVYLRRHGEHVRTMILDGVAPMDMRLPMFTARDAQRALDKLLTDCDADTACKQAFPELPARIRNLLRRLEEAPPTVRIVHPRTGIAEDVRVEARVVASILFSALYSPLTASIVPALVDHAERNEFQSVFALGLAGEGTDENMSVGMQLSVLCSEGDARATQRCGPGNGHHAVGRISSAISSACGIGPGVSSTLRITSRWYPTSRRSCCRAISIPSRRRRGESRS